MLCDTCQKERVKGKVEKGKFICALCVAVAKKDKDKAAISEKFIRIHTAVQRAEQIVHMARYDLNELKNELSNHGIFFEGYEEK